MKEKVKKIMTVEINKWNEKRENRMKKVTKKM